MQRNEGPQELGIQDIYLAIKRGLGAEKFSMVWILSNIV